LRLAVNGPSTIRGILRDSSKSINHSVSRCARRAVLVGASTSVLPQRRAAAARRQRIEFRAEILKPTRVYE
jgi:hypothetical protein